MKDGGHSQTVMYQNWVKNQSQATVKLTQSLLLSPEWDPGNRAESARGDQFALSTDERKDMDWRMKQVFSEAIGVTTFFSTHSCF